MIQYIPDKQNLKNGNIRLTKYFTANRTHLLKHVVKNNLEQTYDWSQIEPRTYVRSRKTNKKKISEQTKIKQNS